jgi:DNA-directed RNA polymerase subunit alpha
MDASEATLVLKKKGPGVVVAADIQRDHDVEILNPQHVIAHINGSAELSMRLKIQRGRGYVAADSRRSDEDETRSIGRLQCWMRPSVQSVGWLILLRLRV